MKYYMCFCFLFLFLHHVHDMRKERHTKSKLTDYATMVFNTS